MNAADVALICIALVGALVMLVGAVSVVAAVLNVVALGVLGTAIIPSGWLALVGGVGTALVGGVVFLIGAEPLADE